MKIKISLIKYIISSYQKKKKPSGITDSLIANAVSFGPLPFYN